MNKHTYIIAGVAALLVLAFVGATQLYRGSERPAQGKATSSPPAPADPSLLVRSDSPTLGPLMARVTVVEFLDPDCESCRAMHPITKRILREYEGRVRLVLRYMPLHPNSAYAASVLEAAGEQGRYWEMLDLLFEYQPQWGDQQTPQPPLILELAARLSLDMKVLQRSLQNPAHANKIQRDHADGKNAGVTGTPTFFVNGSKLQKLGYEPLKAAIDKALAQ